MLSNEGVRLVSLAAMVVVLILVTAAFRTLVGPGKRRGRVMTAGTLGGITFGVLVAVPLSRWFGADVSAIAAFAGMILGWGVAWTFIKQIPRAAE